MNQISDYVTEFRDEMGTNFAHATDKTMVDISQMLQTQLVCCETMQGRFNTHGDIGFAKVDEGHAYPFRFASEGGTVVEYITCFILNTAVVMIAGHFTKLIGVFVDDCLATFGNARAQVPLCNSSKGDIYVKQSLRLGILVPIDVMGSKPRLSYSGDEISVD